MLLALLRHGRAVLLLLTLLLRLVALAGFSSSPRAQPCRKGRPICFSCFATYACSHSIPGTCYVHHTYDCVSRASPQLAADV
jgi:hypothetical protein